MFVGLSLRSLEIISELGKMSEPGLGEIFKKIHLLRPTKDRILWRHIIPDVMKRYDREGELFKVS